MRRDIFQAVADPTRRAIMVLIAMQALTPNAIAAHFDTTRQAVSKHLKILTECEREAAQSNQTRDVAGQWNGIGYGVISDRRQQGKAVREGVTQVCDACLLGQKTLFSVELTERAGEHPVEPNEILAARKDLSRGTNRHIFRPRQSRYNRHVGVAARAEEVG